MSETQCTYIPAERIKSSVSVTLLKSGVCFLIFCLLMYLAGIRVNTSKSIPIGLYETDSRPFEKGRYVMFCPPDAPAFRMARDRGYITAGFCPGGFGYMMKKILAAKGDTVTVTNTGVFVNGKRLPFSRPREADGGGRALPQYRPVSHRLDSSELLLMSDVSATSFDGRYFGPIDRTHIKSTIVPIVTW